MVGYLAASQGTTIVALESQMVGPHLTFITYPTAISLLPFAASIFGIIFFIVALILASVGFKSYIDISLAEVQIGAASSGIRDEIQWFNYSEEKLQEAIVESKPVMLDFYADWCIPCKELDKFTFTAPEVVELSGNFIMLKVDLTTADSPLNKSLREKYNIRGVPTLIFLDSNGEEQKDLRVVGFRERDDFLPIMERALERSQ